RLARSRATTTRAAASPPDLARLPDRRPRADAPAPTYAPIPVKQHRAAARERKPVRNRSTQPIPPATTATAPGAMGRGQPAPGRRPPGAAPTGPQTITTPGPAA